MLLFTILKVIGLVLLILLLLILLLLGLILLAPFHYAGAGHKGEEVKDYDAHIDLCWLLRMVQLHAGITPAGLEYSLRILCFHPVDSRRPDTPTAVATDETSSRGEEATAADDTAANASDETSSRGEEATATDDTAADASDETPSEDEAEAMATDDTAADAADGVEVQDANTVIEEKHPPEDEKTLEESVSGPESEAEASETAAAQTGEVSRPEKKKRKKSSFTDRIKKICAKASSLCKTVEDEENQKAVRLLISRVKYLLHHLRFRRFEGRLAFGFEDPSTVGRVLAVLSLFYPLYGESFTIAPVFDRALFEGEVALKGHVRLIHILIAGIQLMMNKKIRGLVLDRI